MDQQHPLLVTRKNLGFTIAEVAELTGISVCTIGRIERGDKTFKVNEGTAAALATGLDVTVEDLFRKDELSHLGRPALTGHVLASPGHLRTYPVCPSPFCRMENPPTLTTCQMCDTPLHEAVAA